MSTRTQMFALGAILVAALVMRCWDLHALGFWIDEDLTALVTKSIRETGWPLLPSGEAYTRGALYSYLVAGFSSIFGSGEAALRFPSVLFSCLGVAVSFFYARALAGPGAGFVAATILAFSPWDQHYARMARMYALLGAVFLSVAYLVHRGVFADRPRSRVAAWVVAAAAVPIHQIGAMTAVLFWVPHVLRWRPNRIVWSLVGSVLVAFSMFGFRQWQQAARDVGTDGLDLVVAAGSESAKVSLGFLPPITLNHSRFLLGDWLSSDPAAGAAALAGLVLAAALLGWGVRRSWGSNRRVVGREGESGLLSGLLLSRPADAFVIGVLALLFLAGLATNQLVLAATFGLLLWGRLGRARFGWILVVSGVIAVVGFFLGQLVAEGVGGLTDRGFLRLFFAIPVPFYRLFFLHHPVLVAVSALGAAVYFGRALTRRDDGRFFLAALVFGLLLVIGLFESPYVIDRYTFFLNGLSVVLFAVVVADLARWVGDRNGGAGGRRWSLVVLLVGLVLSGQCDPLEAYRATQVTAGYGRPELQDQDLLSHYRYDWRGTAHYLQENMGAEDALVAKDPVELWAYGVESDVRINSLHSVYATTDSGATLDWYLRIPVFSTQAALEDYLREQSAAGRVVWIVYPAEIEDGPAVHLPEEMKTFLRESGSEVFRAPDGVTRVLRLDPQRSR
ncbi:MAG: glycosyltransferase family 39 protein [Candidatus Eisenbacteria bacterium]|uniref:Glycosyltransferase family 39 protein n=1 Tax=Eiseniibacteriota bacterium TaxID=2212470 RepID=A0A956SHF0_UNCEI|nr:glycosyltransferase family 39 protein [Candidatus Eisenbacteria bacterium]